MDRLTSSLTSLLGLLVFCFIVYVLVKLMLGKQTRIQVPMLSSSSSSYFNQNYVRKEPFKYPCKVPFPHNVSSVGQPAATFMMDSNRGEAIIL
jgi:hypothetical protein